MGHKKEGSQNESDEVPQRTIIIGAGVAGLTAAEELQKAGQDYLILEGRGRVGGRIDTQTGPVGHTPTLFELGAAWFHDCPHNHVAYLAEEGGVEGFQDDQQTVIYDTKGKLDQELVNKISTEFDDFRKKRDATDPLEQVSTLFAKVHLKNEDDQRVALAVANAYQLFGGLRMAQLGAHFHGPEGHDLAVQGGYLRLFTELLAKDVDHRKIELNKKVTHVSAPKEGDRVQVTTQDGSHYVGKAVIVTVPLGVLKKESIQFEPRLDGHILKAINNTEVAHVNKVYLTFPETFWNPTTYRFVVSDAESPAMVWNWEATHPGTAMKNTLCVLTTNQMASEVEHNPEFAYDIVKPIVEVIAHTDSIPDPTNVVVSKWIHDEFSEGSFSVVPHGITREEVAKPFIESEPRSLLLFAGEHATLDGAGLVQGAYASGLAAAQKAAKL